MDIHERVRIIGTNHISMQSIEEIKAAFFSYDPDIVAVELDAGRLQQLLHPPKDERKVDLRLIRRLGVRGFLFALLGRYAQQKLGRMVGVKPGSEMLIAVNLARNNHKELALIDKPIDRTIRRLMKELTFKEKRRFIYDLLFGRYNKQQKIKIDISKVPESDLIDTLMLQIKDRYPTIARVLIDERNHFMARRLAILLRKNSEKKILAVVGAGHKKEMDFLLGQYVARIEII